MKIQEIPLAKINPAPYNPRLDLKPADEEYKKIKRSIEVFGLVEPLIWNEHNGTLIGGHQRLKVLQELGRTTAPCVVLSITDPKQERALNIALNKISGDWDIPKLKEVLTELDDGAFDITVTGFDEEELKDLIDWEGPKNPGGGEDGDPKKSQTVICPKCGHEFSAHGEEK